MRHKGLSAEELNFIIEHPEMILHMAIVVFILVLVRYRLGSTALILAIFVTMPIFLTFEINYLVTAYPVEQETVETYTDTSIYHKPYQQ